MKLRFKKLHPDVRIPEHARPGDAGVDLCTVESLSLDPGERKSVPLGLAVEIPEGYVGLLWDKSGLSHTYGIKTFGGVIDAGYRGEVRVGLMNLSEKPFHLEKGDKIVQLLLQKCESIAFEEADELSDTVRGQGGFGSTGK
jgi:dUTP pyrophosphatase